MSSPSPPTLLPHTPELGDRSLFPDLQARAYLNHAAISPASVAVKEAIQSVVDDYARRGVGAFGTWDKQRRQLKSALAALIGAQPEDLALTTNTTDGVTAIAMCLPWKRGNRVVLFSGEFPANVTPWQRAAELFGLQLVFLPTSDYQTDTAQALSRLAQELERGVRLVAVSSVQFRTGLFMPMKEIGSLCAAHGAELFVDAIQGLGAVPADVGAWQVDYLTSGGHKFLMALEGVGFLYIRPERVGALRPHLAGWRSHEEAARFLFDGHGHLSYDRPIRQSADLFEGGTCTAVGFAALDASLGLIQELGVDAIYAHTNAYLDRLEPALVERGFTSLRAADPARRSAILSVTVPPGLSVVALRQQLAQRGVICAIPDGNLRLAPHWPNHPDEVPTVLGALDESLAALR